ncbi:MAG TPA: SURF1 family protein [Nocardioidaceae bacterium]
MFNQTNQSNRSNPYRILLSRRWLGLLLVVVVVAFACYELGRWQFHRYDERHDRNAVTRTNERADPVAIDQLMSSTAPPADADEWRRATASGQYDVAHQLVVLYRTREGAHGVDVVTPLVTGSGDAVLVDRGWVATNGNGNEPADVPDPPPGTVTVTGWVRQDDADTGNRVTPSEGSVRSISSRAIGETVPYELYQGWLSLTDEDPTVQPSPERADPPDLSAGPSFFYGLQWWFFALLAIAFWGYFAYAEVHRDPRGEAMAVVRRRRSEVTESNVTDRG